MNVARLNDELAVALTWLTRLPVRYPVTSAPDLAAAAWAFPVVGAMLGAISATVFVLLDGLGAPNLLSGVITVAALTLLTGAMHDDGLADFFDGLGARGGRTEKLAAMRDSTIGVYGVVALIISFTARVAVITTVEAALGLIIICALSRTFMVHAMHTLPAARSDGAAKSAGVPNKSVDKMAKIIGVGLLGCWIIQAGFDLGGGLVLGVAGILSTAWIMLKAHTATGGITGDVLGAICLASETAMLIALAIWLS